MHMTILKINLTANLKGYLKNKVYSKTYVENNNHINW